MSKPVFLDKYKKGEVELKEAYWMYFPGTTESTIYWAEKFMDRWMAFNCFNAWWSGAILGEYNNPFSAPGLHLYADKSIHLPKVDNIGVVSYQYSGERLIKPDNFAEMTVAGMGWAGVNAFSGLLKPFQLEVDKTKEKMEEPRVPYPWQRGIKHTFWQGYMDGINQYVRVKHMVMYIADRFKKNKDLDLEARLACKKNALDDYHDYNYVIKPIQKEEVRRKVEGKSNNQSKRKELWVLTTKSDEPINAMVDLPLNRSYSVWDDYREKDGMPAIEWTGNATSVLKLQAVIDNNWRLAVH